MLRSIILLLWDSNLVRIVDFQVQHAVNIEGDVIQRDGGLGWNLHDDLFEAVHVLDLIDQWNQEP